MRKFIMSLTTVASLSLAAVPVLGLASTAHAAGPVARIAVGDLDLRDPARRPPSTAASTRKAASCAARSLTPAPA